MEDDLSYDWFMFVLGNSRSGLEVNYWIANDNGQLDQMITNEGNTLIFNG